MEGGAALELERAIESEGETSDNLILFAEIKFKEGKYVEAA